RSVKRRRLPATRASIPAASTRVDVPPRDSPSPPGTSFADSRRMSAGRSSSTSSASMQRSLSVRLAAFLVVALPQLSAAQTTDVRRQATGDTLTSDVRRLPPDSMAFYRALDLEGAGKYREAVPLFRQALQTPTGVSALLGLERVYAELHWTDSLV